MEEMLGNRKKSLTGPTMMNPVEDSRSVRIDAETGKTEYEGPIRESFPGVKLKASNRVQHNTIDDVVAPYEEQAEELKEARKKEQRAIKRNDAILEERGEVIEEEVEEEDVGDDYREKVTGMIKGIQDINKNHPGQSMGVKSGKGIRSV